MAEVALLKGEPSCSARTTAISPTTWRPAWVAGAPTTGRPRFGWLAFVLVAFALGGMAGTKTIDPNTAGPARVRSHGQDPRRGLPCPADESVLVQSRSLSTTDPAFTAAVEDVVARLSKVDVVQNVRSLLDEANAGQIARTAMLLVEFEIRGPADEAADKLDPVLDQVDAAQKAHPELFIGQFGDASAVEAVNTAFADDLGKAGELSLPITLIILVVAFGRLSPRASRCCSPRPRSSRPSASSP